MEKLSHGKRMLHIPALMGEHKLGTAGPSMACNFSMAAHPKGLALTIVVVPLRFPFPEPRLLFPFWFPLPDPKLLFPFTLPLPLPLHKTVKTRSLLAPSMPGWVTTTTCSLEAICM